MPKIIQDVNVLREKSLPIQSAEEAQDIINRLEKVLIPIGHGIGLSAIQIGEPKRVAIVKRTNDTPLYLINPELIEKEDDFIFFNEGCLSIPGENRNTKRYKHITIRNCCIDGNELREERVYFYYSEDYKEHGNDGLLAIAVQHELDHMDGKLIIDYNNANQEPLRNFNKIGRNDPCLCGSGKKYKKCCGG